MDKPTTAARPERIVRLYVEGAEVTPEAFWEAVKRLGGRAVVETIELPQEPRWRPTAKVLTQTQDTRP